MKGRFAAFVSTVLLAIVSANAWATSCSNVKEDVIPTTPLVNFTLHDDGTVTHRSTGLIWMRCSLGQQWNGSTCTGEPDAFSWRLATRASETTDFANYSDWRLPTREELATIIEQRCFSPSINGAVFPNTPPNWYWSSTLDPHHNFFAWYVTFYNGRANSGFRTDANGRVRLVRGTSSLATVGQ